MAVRSIQIRDFFATNNFLADAGEPSINGSSGIIINRHEGFTSPARRVPGYERPNRDGWNRVNQLYGKRTLGFQLQIYGETQAEFEALKAQLVDAANLQNDTQVMTIISDANNIFEVEGIVEELLDVGKYVPNEERFVMRFACDTITFSDLGVDGLGESITISLTDSLEGLEYAVGQGADYVEGQGADYGVGNIAARTANNTGTAPVFPMIRLQGPLNNPVITNTTTGKSFKINITLEADEYVDIDMERQTVVDQDGVNQFARVDAALRNFWSLQVGENIIDFTHQGLINEEAFARVSWAPAVLSI